MVYCTVRSLFPEHLSAERHGYRITGTGRLERTHGGETQTVLTITDLAKKAGVSHSTVSRALNDSPLISRETKEKIRELADECGFVLNSQAQSLKTNKTGTVGILFPRYFTNLTTSIFYTYIYDLLRTELVIFDLDIMVIYNYKDTATLSPLERMIQKRKVDGYIILRPDLSERELALLTENHIPHVCLFRQQTVRTALHNFLIDSEYGGYLAGKFFGAKKKLHLFYLGLQENTVDNTPRIKGFLNGAAEAGYSGEITRIASDMSLEGGYNGIIKNSRLFSGKCGIYAYNDMMAIGAVNALTELRIPVPAQVQIIGTDDIPMASWIHPALSTVHAPAKEMVAQACSTLYSALQGKKQNAKNMTFKPALVHRDTTVV